MRASKSGGGGGLEWGRGESGAGEEGEKELGRKKAITEVQEMKTAYRRDGQME